jgi:hypothetical protein
MSPKAPQKATYFYADVERALAHIFGVDSTGQRGWLRGRLQHFRRLGLAPEGRGKGKTIVYLVEDADRWTVALELAHLRLDPALIVDLINRSWSRRERSRKAGAAFDRGEASIRDLVAVAREGKCPDILVTVRFEPMSRSPEVSYTTMAKPESFLGWLNNGRAEPRRASIFNLSDRIRRLDRALAAPPPPHRSDEVVGSTADREGALSRRP